MVSLGTMKEITDLRKVWPHEALNFTPWVAENIEEVIDDLSDEKMQKRLWKEGSFEQGI